MGDLINRGAVIEVLKQTGIIQDNDRGHLVVDEINRIPTAYDVEKVVAEIKSQFGCKDCEYVDEFQHPACNECAELEVIDDICRIVRKGGWNERKS